MFDDSPDDFIDLTNMEQQSESCALFEELFGDENEAPVAPIECFGDKSSLGTPVINDQWNQLSAWKL